MDITVVKNFLLWCTIINGAMLIFSSIMCVFAGNWIYSMHSKLFGITRDTFNVVIYCFISIYKIFVIIFNLVPYIALVIAG